MSRIKKFMVSLVALPVFSLLFAPRVHAQISWTGCFAKDERGNELPGQILTLSCLPNLFTGLVGWALSLAGIVALFFLIWGGIRLITSGGEKTGVEEARKTITFAIIGLIIILLSFFIVRIIAYVTGTECINMFGFNACQ